MSIYSSITGAISSGYNALKNAFSSSSQTASALQGTYIPNSYTGAGQNTAKDLQTLAIGSANGSGIQVPASSLMTKDPNATPTSYTNLMTPVPTGSNYQLPVQITAGRQSSSPSNNNLASSVSALPSNQTISAKALTSNQSTGATSPLSLSQTPSGYKPPSIDNTGLAGNLSGMYKYNPTTNTYDSIQSIDTTNKTNEQIALDPKKLYESILGTKPDVYSDSAVVEAQNRKRQIEQALQAPVSELNAVIAKQNQDLLQLRQTGSQEGVTEAVYGGQQNAINYNAAIRALPLQAKIASLQGDLKLSQDYLSELITVKSNQINNQYEANKTLFNSIKDAISEKDKRAYEEIKTRNERAYKEATNNLQTQNEWAKFAAQNGHSELIPLIHDIDPASPNFGAKLANIVKSITPVSKTGSGALSALPTSIQGKLISIAQDFSQKPSIKKYIEAVDSANIINNIDPKSTNPADHQQIVYAFAKALDPDSAVKEGEYNTIKKYSQSLISRYGKEITNAINGTGFLSENAIKNIQQTVTNTLNSRKSVYENTLNGTKKTINNIAGSDVADEIMIDFSGGISGSQESVLKSPDGTQQVSISDLTPAQIEEAKQAGWK